MAIGDPYTTRDQLKGILNIELENHEEDWYIDRAVRGAARAIERRSGWPTFWNTIVPVTRQVETLGKTVLRRGGSRGYTKLLLRDGIASLDGFQVAGYSSAALIDEGNLEYGLPFDSIRFSGSTTFGAPGSVSITAIWGWPEVPDDIQLAHQMQAHRFYNRRSSPEGIAGSAEWGITRIPPLDPDVLSILKGGGFMRAGIG